MLLDEMALDPSNPLDPNLNSPSTDSSLPPLILPSPSAAQQPLTIDDMDSLSLPEPIRTTRDPFNDRLHSPRPPPQHPEQNLHLAHPSPMPVDDIPVARNSLQSSRPSPVDPQTYAPVDRPLNVTDALSYLDAVKMQFQDQPDVYNHFLDIMKEFKNERIDTPGVIKRVSHLFNGHPSLIQGFNTFLPVGYRIECSTDAHDASFITVTTPSGTTMQTTNHGTGKGPILWSTSMSSGPLTRTEGGAVGGLEGAMSHIDISSPDSHWQAVDGQAMEPALQYVQKIKQRCDPDTYRQFLDILARYYHKPDVIDEAEISRQIARLFKDAPDLRDDFRVFMPDRSQQPLDDTSAPSQPSMRTGTPVDGRSRRKLDVGPGSSSSAPVSALPQKRKRRPAEKEREKDVVIMKVAPPVSKKLKHANSHELNTISYNPKPTSRAPSPSRFPHQNQMSYTAPRIPPDNDEMHFFDRVKRALDNRDLYNEFLKIVNLFTQDYIDTARLVKESRNFLGDTDLFRQFKEILGWDEARERDHFLAEQQAQNSWAKPVVSGIHERPGRVDLNSKYGSYRKLPASEANVTCSGRDEMCRSVLNDEWVSHPTWSSEDSGFIAHKKNIYEEALHRSEEERHEYDFHIEAIVRTITMLEPINNKIAQLNIEERGNFKLKANLGGSCKAIHQRVIKKIYGREPGLVVLQSMQDTPALAIPVVLQRLKQKEEEWKRAQREWNKVWREVDARNYLKSLDHQAISFKAADKKAITLKALVSQIEAAREEQMGNRASLIDPLFARTRPRHQLEFFISDMKVLQDAMKLTFSFLDRTQAQINFTERKRIEGFLRSFVPLFFNLDAVTFNSAFIVVQQETVESDVSDDVVSNGDDVEGSSTGGKPPRNVRKGAAAMAGIASSSAGGDLRKKLLKSEQAKSTNRKTRARDASPTVSRLASPAPVEEEVGSSDATAPSRKTPRKNVFFTNTTFYVLLRLLEILYTRLSYFKEIASVAMEEARTQRQTKPAIPSGLPSQAQLDFTDTNSSTESDALHAEHFYELMLESCERLFDGEIEQHAFEDQMRCMFGTRDAYKIFTVDKLIGAVIKQVQLVFVDTRSQDLLEILKRKRALVSPTTQDQINHRRNAEKVLGPDENLFRIDWLMDSKTMAIQLLGKDDSSFDDSEVLTGRWQAYIDSYVASDQTEGVSISRVKRPFLRRNLSLAGGDVHPTNSSDNQPGADETPLEIATRDGLEIKVCVRTYRLFYVTGTEDVLWRYRGKGEMQHHASRLGARNALRRLWIAKAKAGS